MKSSRSLRFSRLAVLMGALMGANLANATIVQVQTVMGDFEVNLYDEATPETVANFLAYVEAEAYNDSFMHRSMPDFVLQGGGFYYDREDEKVKSIPAEDPVVNEPVFSNRRGTIAMAKLGSDPNSATNQWFFNLKSNHSNLDVQNGGFTVFGEVVGDGMDVVDAMAELPRFAFDKEFGNLPLRNYGDDEVADKVTVTNEHLVMIHNIQVLDASPDTAADLDPVPNTLIDDVGDGDSNSDSGGSGSLGWLSLMLLVGLGWKRLGKREKEIVSVGQVSA